MKEWGMEVMVVLAHSTKAQIAILVGCLGFIVINFYGSYFVGNLEFHGPLALVTESVRSKLEHRYDKLALIWMVSFFVLAFKAYRTQRARLFGL